MAGLGFPPDVYNQNANEYMNSVLKRDTPKYKKRMTIGEFTNHCRYLEMRQWSQEELAIIGRGELKVSEEYSDLCCEDVKFFQKSEDQMRAAHSKFFNADVRPTSLSGLLDAGCHDEDTTSLSVLPENSKILSVPYQIVKKIFRSGARLLSANNSIVSAPGSSDASFYVTKTSETRLAVAYLNVTNTVFDILVFTFAVMLLQSRNTIRSCKSFLTYLTPDLWGPIWRL